MSTQNESFLKSIAQHLKVPDYDMAFQNMLVYSDWLEEQGDPECAGWRWVVKVGLRPWRSAAGHFLFWDASWVGIEDWKYDDGDVPKKLFTKIVEIGGVLRSGHTIQFKTRLDGYKFITKALLLFSPEELKDFDAKTAAWNDCGSC